VEPLISVIVPIYKVEQYLKQCVDSILNQTYRNLEVILVDDGSPDGCGAICDEYAAQDRRVIVLHKQNGGLSDARNAGMKAMRGEYLMFVDSDDLLTEDCIETLYQLIIEYRAELVIGSSDRIDEHGAALPSVDNVYTNTQVFDRAGAMKDMLTHGCSAWARLYSRTAHENIFFPKGEINEDEAIVLRILERCERVVATDKVIYHYRCRSNSITTKDFSKKKLIWKDHCEANYLFIQKQYPELAPYAAARYCGSLLWSITEIAMLDDWSDYRLDEKEIMKALKENRAIFHQISFSLKRDKIRYFILSIFGFQFYRTALRVKRGKRV
jgi:glycosyltransferase involved in cell wall biosynthesis